MTTQLIAQDVVVILLAVAFLWLYSNYVCDRLKDKVDDRTLSRKIATMRWTSLSWLLLVVLTGLSRQVGWMSATTGYMVGGLLFLAGLTGFVMVRRSL